MCHTRQITPQADGRLAAQRTICYHQEIQPRMCEGMDSSYAHPGLLAHRKRKRRGLVRRTGGFDHDVLASKGHNRSDGPNAGDGRKFQPDALCGAVESKACHCALTQRGAIQFSFAGCQREILRAEHHLNATICAEARGVFCKLEYVWADLDAVCFGLT